MEKSIRKLETEAHRHDRRNETFYSGGEGCELGRVFWLGGNELYAHRRARPHYTPHWPHQHYAAVLVSQGRGFYHGADAQPLPVSPGDLLLMFPGIPFRYQVDRNQHWQETFIAFRGPAFDVLRESGVLQPGRPVWHLSADQDWKGRLRGLWHVDQPGSITQLALIGRLLNFLCDANAADGETQLLNAEPAWLRHARQLLEENSRESFDLSQTAREVGMSYDALRKQFLRHTGETPARYRTQKRIAVAADLLLHTSMSIKQIAANLNFCSEFHFSQKFKQIKGVSPREFRRLR